MNAAPDPPAVRWELQARERFDRPVPPASWQEDTYEQITDPFDEGGAYWGYRTVPEPARWRGDWMPEPGAGSGSGGFRSFRRHHPYGEGGWLAIECYGRDRDGDGVLSPPDGGIEVRSVRGVDGGHALAVRAPSHHDAALIRPAHPLPRYYRVELRVGLPRFTLHELDGREDGGPWSGPARGNGLYLLSVLDAVPVPHNNTWIHPRKVVSIDSFVTPAMVERDARPAPVALEYLGLRGYEEEDAGKGPDDFCYYLHCWDEGAARWRHGHHPSAYLRPDDWYEAAVERTPAGFALELAGRFDDDGPPRRLRATIGHAEGKVWHGDRPGDPPLPFTTNPATWRPGGFPHYFALGVPHINWYRGSVQFSDLRLYRGVPAGA